MYNKIGGVWNLSNERGNLGAFHVTNVRLVWHADAAENFNVSIPYVQMKSVAVRESKFGPCLVVNTTNRSGGYILGFRIEPVERLQTIFQEIEALFKVFSVNHVFGVEFSVEERAQNLASVTVKREQDDVTIVDERAGMAPTRWRRTTPKAGRGTGDWMSTRCLTRRWVWRWSRCRRGWSRRSCGTSCRGSG